MNLLTNFIPTKNHVIPLIITIIAIVFIAKPSEIVIIVKIFIIIIIIIIYSLSFEYYINTSSLYIPVVTLVFIVTIIIVIITGPDGGPGSLKG